MKLIPKRAFLGFEELLERWGWTSEDLRDAIAEGHIIPAIRPLANISLLTLECKPPGYFAEQQSNFAKKTKIEMYNAYSFLYLHCPMRLPGRGYVFMEYSNSTEPDTSEVIPFLKKRCSREDYREFLFLMAEIERSEAAVSQPDLEACFTSPEMHICERKLQEKSWCELDNESKERALVGDVISTVALAGQICREKTVSDHGIDMEIEFKNNAYEATGQMLFLQLKSGDSYLRKRKGDGAEIFTIKDERHARYWMTQQFPVLLVIRNSDGEIRWMEIRDWLKRESQDGKKPVKQIIFEGERFDVTSVRRWR
ncbi:MAG: DUF4365 domain-containing protein, partial [Methylomagnum sp.]